MREGRTSKRTVTPLKTRHLTRLVMVSLRDQINAIMILSVEPPFTIHTYGTIVVSKACMAGVGCASQDEEGGGLAFVLGAFFRLGKFASPLLDSG